MGLCLEMHKWMLDGKRRGGNLVCIVNDLSFCSRCIIGGRKDGVWFVSLSPREGRRGEKGFTRKLLWVECEAFLFLSLLLAYFCLLLLPSVCLSDLGSSRVESAVVRVDRGPEVLARLYVWPSVVWCGVLIGGVFSLLSIAIARWLVLHLREDSFD